MVVVVVVVILEAAGGRRRREDNKINNNVVAMVEHVPLHSYIAGLQSKIQTARTAKGHPVV